MKEYKIYGGLKYLIHDGKNAVFRFVSYEEKKKKKTKKKKTNKKIYRKNTRKVRGK